VDKDKIHKILETDEEKFAYDDAEIYEEETEEEEIVADVCKKDELTVFITLLTDKIVNGALNKGIRIIFDIEPVLYESVLNLYSISTYCSKAVLTEENGAIVDTSGKSYRMSFSLFKIARPDDNEILVVFMRENPDKFWDEFESLVSMPRLVYFIVTKGQPEINVSTAVYFRNLIPELFKKTFLIMKEYTKDDSWEKKINYIGRVPFDVLLHLPLNLVEQISETWTPPPPPNANYLYKSPRPLSELVVPDSVRREIERFIELSKIKRRGSLLLIGLPTSGRKTIAKTIATELGLPSYYISISNILSRWVGESESKLNAFFEGMRARGGLAVFENVESLFRKSTGENVTANLRSILFQQMARDDNNFIIVFTSNENCSPELFDSPLIGETKIVIPPPNKNERRKLTRMFLREIYGEHWNKLIEIAKNQYKVSDSDAENVLFSFYADPFSASGVGLTSGEIYRSMDRILLPTLTTIIKEGKLAAITDDIMLLSRRDYTARLAKLKTLKQKAILLGNTAIADSIMEVEKEVSIRAVEIQKIMEKYKDY